MDKQAPTLREQTGADKIYVLNRYGKTILLPVKASSNPASDHDFALSHLAMADKFIPALTSHLGDRNMGADEIKGITNLLFEDQRYLGHSWHRRRVMEDPFEEGEVFIVGNGKKNSFYGSAYGGKVVSVVNSLDGLQLN